MPPSAGTLVIFRRKLQISDELIFWYERFHNAPPDKVSKSAHAENDEITRFNPFISHEPHVGVRSMVKQDTRTLVDEIRADPSSHSPDARDSSYGVFGEHIAHGGEDVSRP